MKKLILIPLALILLCGCNQPKKISEDVVLNNDLTINEEKRDYINQYDINNYYFEDEDDLPSENMIYSATGVESRQELSKLLLKKAEEDVAKLPLISTTLTQEGQANETVKVYKDKNYDILIATDGSSDLYVQNSYTIYNQNISTPTAYENIINSFKEKEWHFTGSITGSTLNRLDFNNDEYLLSNNSYSYYSVTYDNVTLNSENIPLALSVYLEDNKVTMIYIKYYNFNYQDNTLSIDNINMLRDALSLAGIKDFDVIINSLQDNIKTEKSKNIDLQSYSIRSIAPISIQNNMTQGTIMVSLK